VAKRGPFQVLSRVHQDIHKIVSSNLFEWEGLREKGREGDHLVSSSAFIGFLFQQLAECPRKAGAGWVYITTALDLPQSHCDDNVP
jgi:hypothetical protein